MQNVAFAGSSACREFRTFAPSLTLAPVNYHYGHLLPSCRLAYRTVWDHVHKIQDITVKFWMGNFQVTTHSVISPVKEVSLRQTGSECVCLCVLQLIHTFLAQDSALVGPRTRLHALTVSSTIYARLRLRYSAVKETSKLLGFLFRLVA